MSKEHKFERPEPLTLPEKLSRLHKAGSPVAEDQVKPPTDLPIPPPEISGFSLGWVLPISLDGFGATLSTDSSVILEVAAPGRYLFDLYVAHYVDGPLNITAEMVQLFGGTPAPQTVGVAQGDQHALFVMDLEGGANSVVFTSDNEYALIAFEVTPLPA
jgi:hypothetical protein